MVRISTIPTRFGIHYSKSYLSLEYDPLKKYEVSTLQEDTQEHRNVFFYTLLFINISTYVKRRFLYGRRYHGNDLLSSNSSGRIQYAQIFSLTPQPKDISIKNKNKKNDIPRKEYFSKNFNKRVFCMNSIHLSTHLI